jgi:protoheme IX farnesyltransferase
VKEAYQFWKHQGANGSARGLFWASIWQLPILLIGGLVTKKGLWDGVWRSAFGQPIEDDDDDDYVYYEVASGKAIEPASNPRPSAVP